MRANSQAVEHRVLLTEMDRTRAQILAAVLRSNGYGVVLSPSGGEVRQRLEAERFRVIISDWNPAALELLTQVRGNGHEGYTYVIITGDNGDDMQRGMAAGADDFLVKPVDATVLLARMRVAERIGAMREAIARKNEELSETNLELARINDRMSRELSAAARVQQSLLPSPGFRAPGSRIGWRLRPCHELAGDILNCIRIDEHHLAFYVLDVSGHGVSSALLSVQVSRLMSPMMTDSELLKERLTEPPWYRVVEPGRVVRRLNELFQTRGEMTQYFTIIYGLLHLASGRLRLAAGGHPGPILVPRSGDPTQVACRSNPVGLLEDAEFFEREARLEVGDRIWVYSDGVTEAIDAEGRMLGEARLESYVAQRREEPVQEAVDGVMRAVETWSMPGEPDDDCSLLAIERT